jgi:hypothetical protein
VGYLNGEAASVHLGIIGMEAWGHGVRPNSHCRSSLQGCGEHCGAAGNGTTKTMAFNACGLVVHSQCLTILALEVEC